MFRLHPRLREDCIDLGRLELCRLLLMNERDYPWCILVPEREEITEIHQLSASDQAMLIGESSRLARVMTELFQPDKLNIAAIGNLVPQLHIHHVARTIDDPAWPAPVWGRASGGPRTANEIERIRVAIAAMLPVARA